MVEEKKSGQVKTTKTREEMLSRSNLSQMWPLSHGINQLFNKTKNRIKQKGGL